MEDDEKYSRIKPLYEKLKEGKAITANDVLPFAESIITRESTYALLKEHKYTDLFPKQFFNIESGAATNLANWLEFPTELDAFPDDLIHIKRVTIRMKGGNVYYHVFKFRKNEPHWAAKEGWMIGVVGPYFHDSEPYDWPGGTFSRFSKIGAISPEEEAKWVHENIALKK